jgi:hypothetical protein
MDGPVVTAARQALESGNVNLVLVWIKKADEATIREAFQKTLIVRKAGPDAKALADNYFFETLVRVHRAGEGVGYTGLKPAGQPEDAAIAAVDRAVARDSVSPVLDLIEGAVPVHIKERFAEVRAKKNYSANDVDAGREYVNAYVEFMHYVKGIHDAAAKPGSHGEHGEEAEGAHARHEE